MKNLMELVIRFKKTRSEIILAEIFEIIKSMMWKYIHRINQFYKEDFMQELFIKTYEIIVKFEIQINPFDSASIIRNQKQLIYLLKSKYKYLVADFYRNNRKYLEKEIENKRQKERRNGKNKYSRNNHLKLYHRRIL